MTGDVIDRITNRASPRPRLTSTATAPAEHDESVRILSLGSLRFVRLMVKWPLIILASLYAAAFLLVFISTGTEPDVRHWPDVVWAVRTGIVAPATLWFLGLFAWSARQRSGIYGASVGLLVMLLIWMYPPGA